MLVSFLWLSFFFAALFSAASLLPDPEIFEKTKQPLEEPFHRDT
jgi:hypothetical protein